MAAQAHQMDLDSLMDPNSRRSGTSTPRTPRTESARSRQTHDPHQQLLGELKRRDQVIAKLQRDYLALQSKRDTELFDRSSMMQKAKGSPVASCEIHRKEIDQLKTEIVKKDELITRLTSDLELARAKEKQNDLEKIRLQEKIHRLESSLNQAENQATALRHTSTLSTTASSITTSSKTLTNEAVEKHEAYLKLKEDNRRYEDKCAELNELLAQLLNMIEHLKKDLEATREKASMQQTRLATLERESEVSSRAQTDRGQSEELRSRLAETEIAASNAKKEHLRVKAQCLALEQQLSQLQEELGHTAHRVEEAEQLAREKQSSEEQLLEEMEEHRHLEEEAREEANKYHKLYRAALSENESLKRDQNELQRQLDQANRALQAQAQTISFSAGASANAAAAILGGQASSGLFIETRSLRDQSELDARRSAPGSLSQTFLARGSRERQDSSAIGDSTLTLVESRHSATPDLERRGQSLLRQMQDAAVSTSDLSPLSLIPPRSLQASSSSAVIGGRYVVNSDAYQMQMIEEGGGEGHSQLLRRIETRSEHTLEDPTSARAFSDAGSDIDGGVTVRAEIDFLRTRVAQLKNRLLGTREMVEKGDEQSDLHLELMELTQEFVESQSLLEQTGSGTRPVQPRPGAGGQLNDLAADGIAAVPKSSQANANASVTVIRKQAQTQTHEEKKRRRRDEVDAGAGAASAGFGSVEVREELETVERETGVAPDDTLLIKLHQSEAFNEVLQSRLDEKEGEIDRLRSSLLKLEVGAHSDDILWKKEKDRMVEQINQLRFELEHRSAIVQETQQQVTSRQSAEARLIKQLEEQRALIGTVRQEAQRLQAAISEAHAESSQYRLRIESITVELQEASEEVERVHEQLAQRDILIEALQVDLAKQLESHQGDSKLWEKWKLEIDRRSTSEREALVEETCGQMTQLRSEKQRLEEKLEASERRFSEMQTRIEQLSRLDIDITDSRSKQQSAEIRVNELEIELNKLRSLLESSRGQSEEVTGEITNLRELLSQRDLELEQRRRDLSLLEVEVRARGEQLEEYKSKYGGCVREMEQLRSQLALLVEQRTKNESQERTISQLQLEIKSLKENTSRSQNEAVSAYVAEVSRLREQLIIEQRQYEQKSQNAESELIKMRHMLDSSQGELAKYRAQADHNIQERRTEFARIDSELRVRIEHLEGELGDSRSKHSQSAQLVEQLRRELDSYHTQHRDCRAKEMNMQEEISRVLNELNTTRMELKRAEAASRTQVDISVYTEQTTRLREQLVLEERKNEGLERTIAQLKVELENLKDGISRAQSEAVAIYVEQVTRLREQLVLEQRQTQEASDEAANLRQELNLSARRHESITYKQEERSRADKLKIESLEVTVTRLQSEVKRLEVLSPSADQLGRLKEQLAVEERKSRAQYEELITVREQLNLSSSRFENSVHSLEDQVRAKQSEIEGYLRTIAKLELEIKRLEGLAANASRAHSELIIYEYTEQITQLKEQLVIQERLAREAVEECTLMKEHKLKLKLDLIQTLEKLEHLRSEFDTAVAQRENERRTVISLQRQLDDLRELYARLQRDYEVLSTHVNVWVDEQQVVSEKLGTKIRDQSEELARRKVLPELLQLRRTSHDYQVQRPLASSSSTTSTSSQNLRHQVELEHSATGPLEQLSEMRDRDVPDHHRHHRHQKERAHERHYHTPALSIFEQKPPSGPGTFSFSSASYSQPPVHSQSQSHSQDQTHSHNQSHSQSHQEYTSSSVAQSRTYAQAEPDLSQSQSQYLTHTELSTQSNLHSKSQSPSQSTQSRVAQLEAQLKRQYQPTSLHNTGATAALSTSMPLSEMSSALLASGSIHAGPLSLTPSRTPSRVLSRTTSRPVSRQLSPRDPLQLSASTHSFFQIIDTDQP